MPIPESSLDFPLRRSIADNAPVHRPPELGASRVCSVKACAYADCGAVGGDGEGFGCVVRYGCLLGFGEGSPDGLRRLDETLLYLGYIFGGGVTGERTKDWEAGGERGEVDVGGKTISGGRGRVGVGVWRGVGGIVCVGGGHIEGHCCGWGGSEAQFYWRNGGSSWWFEKVNRPMVTIQTCRIIEAKARAEPNVL